MTAGYHRQRVGSSGWPGGGQRPFEPASHKHWVVGARGQEELVTELPRAIRAIEHALRDLFDEERDRAPRGRGVAVREATWVRQWLDRVFDYDDRKDFMLVDHNKVAQSIRSVPQYGTSVCSGMLIERLVDVDILAFARKPDRGADPYAERYAAGMMRIDFNELDAWVASALLFLGDE